MCIINRFGKNALCLLFFSLMPLMYGCPATDSETHQIKNEAPAFTLKANKLFKEYSDNEVAADAKYKGKVVVVSGTVQNIGKDMMDQAYVVIGGSGLMDGVQCTFTKGENNSVAALTKGVVVNIKGEVTGKMGNVLLDKSSLL